MNNEQETKKDTQKKVGQKEYLEVINASAYYETRKVYSIKGFATPEGEKWPTADLTTPNKKLKACAQLRPDPQDIEPRLTDEQLAQWQNIVREHIMAMDDLTADVLDIVSAIWLRKAESWESTVIVTADDFLSIRGLQKNISTGTGRRGGYTEEQRKEIARQLAILSDTWLIITEMEIIELMQGKKGPYRKRKKWAGMSRAVVVSSLVGEIEEMKKYDRLKPFVWRVRPGDVFAPFLFGPGRQTALLAQKALEFDPYRRKYEKRWTRYLSYQWRIRQSSGNYLSPFRVETLLKAANLEIDKQNPIRTKERLEEGMDFLQEHNITGSWQYETGFDESMVGQKGWAENWWIMQNVSLEPPQQIMDQYAKIKNPSTQKTKALPKGEAISIGEKLKEARLQRGLTQMQAAEQIGIHQSRIARIERGENASHDTVTKIEKWISGER